MEHNDEIGFQVHRLSHLIRHSVNESAFSDGEVPVTGMQGWIIGYLYANRDKDIFQRDVQNHLSVRRSTVTGILQTMEKNGLVVRSSVSWDQRLKKLELTPCAMQMHEHVVQSITDMDRRLSSMLTAEEKKTFLRLCEKIRSGLEERRA